MSETDRRMRRQEAPHQAMSRCWCRFVFFIFLLAACPPPARPTARTVATAVVVLDASTSTDVSGRCEELTARVSQYLASPEVKRLDLAVFQTGGVATAGEPIVLIPFTSWVPRRQLYAAHGARQEARRAWVDEITARCRATIHPMTVSPILMAMTRARESLLAHCAELSQRKEPCGQQRLIALHSDLRESVHPALAARLLGSGTRLAQRRLAPLPKVDMSGVLLAICGSANHRGVLHTGSASPEALLELWREVLGVADLHVDASCPRAEGAPSGQDVTSGGRR